MLYQGLKPNLIGRTFTAGLKPRPFGQVDNKSSRARKKLDVSNRKGTEIFSVFSVLSVVSFSLHSDRG